jgi:DNA-binding NtrC family response regulator
MTVDVMSVLLVGPDAALLEGLSQSVAALGHLPMVADSLREAREIAASQPPIVAVVDKALAAESSAAALAVNLVPGGAFVLYHTAATRSPMLAPFLQRAVLADLTLPLERQRLIALVQHVAERVRATGRQRHTPPPEHTAR